MPIEVRCAACGASHSVNDRFAGRQLRCPECQQLVDVPQSTTIPTVKAIEPIASGLSQVAKQANDVIVRPAVDAGSAASKIQIRENSLPEMSSPPVPPAEEDDDDVMPIKLKPEDSELDMTPMVDVTFLLLIFFMITAAFSLQKSIESPRQQSDAPSSKSEPKETDELEMVTVQINEFGSYLVLAPDWERETPGKQNLIRALRDALGDSNTAMKLAIEVHEMAKLQALVDCMDAGSICGYGEVQVTQVEGFE